jgi:hypothetical protein
MCTGYNLYVAIIYVITCTKCSQKKIITSTKALILLYSFPLDTRDILSVLFTLFIAWHLAFLTDMTENPNKVYEGEKNLENSEVHVKNELHISRIVYRL